MGAETGHSLFYELGGMPFITINVFYRLRARLRAQDKLMLKVMDGGISHL